MSTAGVRMGWWCDHRWRVCLALLFRRRLRRRRFARIALYLFVLSPVVWGLRQVAIHSVCRCSPPTWGSRAALSCSILRSRWHTLEAFAFPTHRLVSSSSCALGDVLSFESRLPCACANVPIRLVAHPRRAEGSENERDCTVVPPCAHTRHVCPCLPHPSIEAMEGPGVESSFEHSVAIFRNCAPRRLQVVLGLPWDEKVDVWSAGAQWGASQPRSICMRQMVH